MNISKFLCAEETGDLSYISECDATVYVRVLTPLLYR